MARKLVSEFLKIRKISQKVIFIEENKYIKIFELKKILEIPWTEEGIREKVSFWRRMLMSIDTNIKFIITSTAYTPKDLKEHLGVISKKFKNNSSQHLSEAAGEYLNEFSLYLRNYSLFRRSFFILLIHEDKVTKKNFFRDIFKFKKLKMEKREKEKSALNIFDKKVKKFQSYFSGSNFVLKELDDFEIHKFLYNIFNLEEYAF